ncbi:hypothetical protein KKA27_01830 [Patescibacteria group bacterium]|nr:hypothetical protein [Patescibacteria group bacterium]MBU2633481.1 hypothetical protein [Patescibacteria group bacterium]
MNINPKIFRAYDVRGVYGEDISEDIFYTLGGGFASYIDPAQNGARKGKIAVGRDIRPSSLSLSDSFVNGLKDSGIDVLNIGEATTPMLYFAVDHLGCDGGAMITASHNPQTYNGIKFTDKNAQPIGGVDIERFLREAKLKDFNKKGAEKSINVSGDYLDLITKNFKINRKIKINIDTRESVVGLFLPSFLEKMGIEVCASSDADFSVSFDADGDRLKVFDENKNEIRGDIVGGIIADAFLEKGDLIIQDVVSTRKLKKHFQEKGIRTEISRVGHFYIKKAMKEKNAVFGLEISSHYYFGQLNYVESALFALRMLLEALDKNSGLKISELADRFSGYFHSGEINLPLSSKGEWDKILEKVKEKYGDGNQNFEDGILVEYPNPVTNGTSPASGGASWWFNLRPSNTEPLMRLVIEAETETLMEEKKEEILEFLDDVFGDGQNNTK